MKSPKSALAYDISTFNVLWRRDLKRFFRQPSRIVGALGQPVIFWLMIGTGLTSTFSLPGTSLSYLEFFYPGVVMMVVLFASIFSSVSVIEDKKQGFLQAVLAGPGSRSALVVGKCVGSTMVALAQAGLFLLLMPLAGFSLGQINWPLLIVTLSLTSLGLTALGFAIAWLLDSVQGYHAIQMTLLVPLWVISGAMFPPSAEATVLNTLMRYNPIAYSVTAVRHAFYNGASPASTTLSTSPIDALFVVTCFAAVSLLLATQICERR